MKPKVHRSPGARLRRHPRGFALVVTISLMILLTIIAVGLLTLSGITLRSSSQAESMQTARANARLALMLAIAQIQESTGPDQRITMAADQRSKSSDGKETSAATGNRHWTGVYKSWPSTAKDRPTPEFVSWLVSGDPDKADDTNLPDAAVSTNDAIQLVGTGTLGSNTDGIVRVPATKLLQPNGKSARLAWWTGDQGLKAAVSAPPPPTGTSFGVARQTLQSAPGNAIQNMTAGTQRPFEQLKPDDARLQLISSWQQSEFLASTPTSQQPLFHDLAPFSRGLLTNVAAGGFRKDLSMQLERPAGSPPNVNLYMVNNEPGINLGELWVYYNSYKDIRRSGSYTFTTGGALSSGTPHMLVESSASACVTDDEFHLKQPVIISYQMVLSLQALVDGTGANAVNRLHVVCDPILTLWNPLDIPVAIPQSAFISVKYWQIPYTVTVRSPRGVVTAPLAASLSGQSSTDATDRDQNFMSIQLGTSGAEQIVLRPGEVVKFSQSGPVLKRSANQSGRHTLIAKKGFNYGGGFAFPLRDLAGNMITVTAADTITYEAVANQYTAGKTSLSGFSVTGANAHSRHFSLTHHEVYVGPDRGELAANSLGYGTMAIDWDFGDKRLRPSELRTDTIPGTKDKNFPNSRLIATKFPEIFKPVSGSQTRPLSGSQLLATKSPFMLLSFDAKTETGSQTGTRSLTRMNPKAHHIDFYDLSAEERNRLPYEFKVEPMVSWVNRSLDLSPNGAGFFGGGMTAQDGVTQVVTHSIPREPIVSLAAFQHSFANGFEIHRPKGEYATLNAREPMMPHISHAIGNSLAPPVLASDKTEGTLPGNRPLADHSFLANKALWDDWFLSGIAPQRADVFGAAIDQRTLARDFLDGKRKLPTVRYIPNADGQSSTQLISSFFSGSQPNNNAINNIASYLQVDGLFNVNSTSVEAWKALLGTLKGRPIVVRDQNGRETIRPADSNASTSPVAGLLNPQDLVAKGNTVDIKDPAQWTGRRELTDQEIDELARALVAEIRRRGPFLSLADFVNRRVGNDKDLAKAGALQSALDSKDVKLNSAYSGGGRSTGSNGAFAFPEAEAGPISYGIPGIVKQADILTPIAPVLSARSDSFVIRAYGEAVDANGRITARAWCEAVVERDRNFVDPSDKAEALPNTWKKVNQDFGRRYDLVSFRWLSDAEI